jgi:hypothetical protein
MLVIFTNGNIEYYFERRRYGSRAFFTWLNYRVKPNTAWKSFGDPWPKQHLSRAELQSALAEISKKAEAKANDI